MTSNDLMIVTAFFISTMISTLVCADDAWPASAWTRAEPQEVGLDNNQLIKARDYALTGGGSGYITRGGDNWPMTWADDDRLYTAYGDGKGFEPFVDVKLSMGLSRITGSADSFTSENLRSSSFETKGDGAGGKKASGLLMVDGTLYLLARNAGNSQLAWSADHGETWTWSDWRFTESFGCPTFLNFGRNYSGARDEFVYVYSHDNDSAYKPADRMVLARVPKDRIRHRDAYEFYAGLTGRANRYGIRTSPVVPLSSQTRATVTVRESFTTPQFNGTNGARSSRAPTRDLKAVLESMTPRNPGDHGPWYSSPMHGTSAPAKHRVSQPNGSATMAAQSTLYSPAMINFPCVART